MTVDFDPRFRGSFEELLARSDLLDLDSLMKCDGFFEEIPLFATYSQVSFLDELSLMERNCVLIRAATAHLGRILKHAELYYAGRDFDFFGAVTLTGWEFLPEGDTLTPRFWLANPSKGVFDHLMLQPPGSEGSQLVAYCLDHDPDYLLNDDIVHEFGEQRLERVFVQHVGNPVPRHNVGS